MYDICKQVVMILVLALLFLLVLKTRTSGGRMVRGRGGDIMIFIKTPDRNTISLNVDDTSTVGDILTITRREKIISDNQVLSFLDKTPDPNLTLADIGASAESIFEIRNNYLIKFTKKILKPWRCTLNRYTNYYTFIPGTTKARVLVPNTINFIPNISEWREDTEGNMIYDGQDIYLDFGTNIPNFYLLIEQGDLRFDNIIQTYLDIDPLPQFKNESSGANIKFFPVYHTDSTLN